MSLRALATAVRALVAATTLLTVDARPARACTPLSLDVWGRTVLPEAGATEVPRNARILVEYDSYGGDPGATLTLRVQGGAAIDVTSTTPRTLGFARLLAPVEPLAASTTYELLDTLSFDCPDVEGFCLGDATVIATFTTGAGLDTQPPAITAISVGQASSCVFESCPEGQNEQVEFITITAQDDDQPATWIRYEYLSSAGEVIAGPTSARTTGRGCGGGPGYVPFYIFLGTPPAFQIRAVDLTGNVEVTAHGVVVVGTCAEIDAACAADADPGNGSDAGAGADGDAGGCGCAAGRDTGGAGVIALCVLLVLGRRRCGRRRGRA